MLLYQCWCPLYFCLHLLPSGRLAHRIDYWEWWRTRKAHWHSPEWANLYVCISLCLHSPFSSVSLPFSLLPSLLPSLTHSLTHTCTMIFSLSCIPHDIIKIGAGRQYFFDEEEVGEHYFDTIYMNWFLYHLVLLLVILLILNEHSIVFMYMKLTESFIWSFLYQILIYVGDSKRQIVGLLQSQSFVLKGLLVNYFMLEADETSRLNSVLHVHTYWKIYPSKFRHWGVHASLPNV